LKILAIERDGAKRVEWYKQGAQAFLKNVLALFLGIVLALIMLEGLIRIFEPIEFRVRGNKLQLQVSRKWVVRAPGVPGLDEVIYHQTNWLGFRGENPPKNFADYLTIMTVGGSTTHCRNISEGKTWTALLGEKLKKSFPKLWINNAGIDGQTTFGHLILMEDIIVELRPKVVLFLVGANDQHCEASNTADLRFLRTKNNSCLGGLINSLVARSEVHYYLINFLRYYQARKWGLLHHPVDLTKTNRKEVTEKQIEAAKEEHRKKYLESYARRLTKLVEISRENNIEPILLTQPYLLGQGLDDRTGVDLATVDAGSSGNGKMAWEILELYNDVVRQVGQDHQTLIIDLARELPKSSRNFYDFFHYTNEGSAEIANIIYQHLNPFLQKKASSPSFVGRHN
jgi:lysophospholipase L1-like esterase